MSIIARGERVTSNASALYRRDFSVKNHAFSFLVNAPSGPNRKMERIVKNEKGRKSLESWREPTLSQENILQSCFIFIQMLKLYMRVCISFIGRYWDERTNGLINVWINNCRIIWGQAGLIPQSL